MQDYTFTSESSRKETSMNKKLQNGIDRIRDIAPLGLAGIFGYKLGGYWWAVFCLLILIVMVSEIINQDSKNPAKGAGYRGPVSRLFILAFMGPISMIALRGSDDGSKLLLLTLCMTTAFDVFSWVGGMLFARNGGHKVTPNESPNKTWEGLIVGTLLSGVSALILLKYALGGDEISMHRVPLLIMVFAIPVVAFYGDLNESMVKRRLFVSLQAKSHRVWLKDFSLYLRTHGGYCDRFDGHTATATFVYCWFWLFG